MKITPLISKIKWKEIGLSIAKVKATETIMNFPHNDPAVNPSPPNPRLNYHLAMDKKSRRD